MFFAKSKIKMERLRSDPKKSAETSRGQTIRASSTAVPTWQGYRRSVYSYQVHGMHYRGEED